MTATTQEAPVTGWDEAAQRTLAIVDNHVRSVDTFNVHDAAAVALAYVPHAVVHDPAHPEPLRGRDAVRDDYATLFRAFPDIRVTVHRVFLSGATIAYTITLAGTHDGPLETPAGTVPATGRSYEVEASIVADAGPSGQYERVRRYYDLAGAMTQLGLGH